MKNVLVVDDDADFRSNIVEVLSDDGYRTESAPSVADALTADDGCDFDIVLLDYMMPRRNGIDAISEIRGRHRRAKVIMITAFATVDNAVEAVKKGAADYICKPFKIDDLLTKIRRVLEESRFERSTDNVSVDQSLAALSSPIRRDILKLLGIKGPMRLMEITRELEIEDHTKVVFHLKILKEGGEIAQDAEKLYEITTAGKKLLSCFETMEKMISS